MKLDIVEYSHLLMVEYALLIISRLFGVELAR